MTIAKTFTMAGLAALCLAAPAHAGQRYMASAPAQRSYPSTQTLRCNILNLNNTAQSVVIESMDYNGIATSTSGELVIAPQTGASHVAVDSFGDSAYCRFTVNGSTKNFRAVAVYDDATQYTTANVAQ